MNSQTMFFRIVLSMVIAMMFSLVLAKETVAESDDDTEIRVSIEKAIALLEKASAGSAENRTCFTCHSQALPVMAVAEAKLRGFVVDEANLQRQLDHTAEHLKRGQQNYLKGKGQGGRVDTAGYALWALEAGNREPDEVTTAVAEYLLKTKDDNGRWKRSSNRPPSEASDFSTTYVALRALSVFGTKEQTDRVSERTEAAAQWLAEGKPSDTEDRVFQLRSLQYTNVDAETQSGLATKLIGQQREDGGWGQRDDLQSDAYATGSVLTCLARTGFLDPTDKAYQRGLRFLLDSQKDDGSWHVVSRSKPFQKYFETGFPHEKDQFISTSATAWAVIAMALSLPEVEPVEKQTSTTDEPDAKSTTPVLIESRRIWNRATHNAFTDLLWHKDRWYCVFREGKAHVSPDGALRVITSEDGQKWESLALVESSKYDLRDAKIAVTPSGQLMLNGAGMIADADVRYYSMSWFSDDDGKTWDDGHQIGDPGFWLWRAHWHDGKVYSMGYNTQRDRTKRTMKFYRSEGGRKFETLVNSVSSPNGCGEDKILFMKDGSALCLLRHETGNKLAQLGTAQPPYTDWKWRDLNARIGGPNMIQLPDGRILAVTRLYDGGTRTSLSWLDPDTAKLTEVLKLPSSGDTSYPGMVLKGDILWISYYSSHEGKTSIYLAKVQIL
jgi:hypothetical protein